MPWERNLEWEHGIQLLEKQRNQPCKDHSRNFCFPQGMGRLDTNLVYAPRRPFLCTLSPVLEDVCNPAPMAVCPCPADLSASFAKLFPHFFFFRKIVCKCVQKEIASEIKIKQLNTENMKNSYGSHLQDLV